MVKISTIILDLGGVILNLDQERTLREFKELGLNLQDPGIHRDFFNVFEKGHMDEPDFRQHIRTLCKIEVTDDHIDKAWNAMLLDVPKERIDIIKNLRSNYNVILLSNTNTIHIRHFTTYYNHAYPNLEDAWENLFNKIYYSYNIGMRKPDKEIYDFVLEDLGLVGEECIFIDDNTDNVKGAALSGIHIIHAHLPLSEITIKKMEEIVTG